MISDTNNKVIESADAPGAAAFSAVGLVLSGYESGFELVSGSHPDAIERFIVLCVRGTPRLLLPTKTPVMRTAVMSFLGRRRFAFLVPPFIQLATKAGGPFSRISSDVSLISPTDTTSPLRKLMSRVLERNDFHIAMRLSFGRPNAKTVAMAISDAGEELCFAKFGSDSMTNDLVAHESAILEQFESSDIPMIVPRRLFSGKWSGDQNVLITAPLKLKSLKRDARSAHQASDAFAAQNLISNSTLSDSVYWRHVIERLKDSDNDDNSKRSLITIASRIEQTWGKDSLDFGASHGDWSRANLGTVGERIAALDWERYTNIAPRGIDIAHFAICENAFGSLDIERAAKTVKQYQNSANITYGNAELLVMLASLEMVIRFKSAQNMELRSADSKFESALHDGLQKWAQ